MSKEKMAELSKKILMPGRSLLLPMMILALGLHAALLALPIPSSETPKAAEDKKNPITVSQIPTEQPAAPAARSGTARVNVPALPQTVTNAATETDSSTPDSAAASSSSSATDSSAKSSPAKSTFPASTSASLSGTSSSSPGATTSSDTAPESATPSDPAPPAGETASTSASAPSASSDFPHYQPSEADCYGLGFGDNCRIVESSTIAQVTDYFKKELVAKDFTANLVVDEPNRKVFKVLKGDNTLFLNIWQGKGKVSYLVSKVMLKQAPETLKTEAGQ